jgi:ribokinase
VTAPRRRPPREAVVAVGSVHVDLIATAPRLPRPGEGVLGERFEIHPGGKAANQATQSSRYGVHTLLVGRVGADGFGDFLRERLLTSGVDLTYLTTDQAATTGASPVFTDVDGVYASVIVPGAAGRVGRDDVDAVRPVLAAAAVLLVQLEIDPNVSTYAAELARAAGCRVVFNASPAPSDPATIPARLFAATDVLIVNGSEADVMSGNDVTGAEGAFHAASALRQRYDVSAAVITLGADGVVAATVQGQTRIPARQVEVVETIGAGDAFAGALGAELARGSTMEQALPVANAAGALAVTRRGAFEALPTREEIDALLARS